MGIKASYKNVKLQSKTLLLIMLKIIKKEKQYTFKLI